MKTKNQDNSADHITDLRVQYIEGILSREEQLRFEHHLQECPQCAEELRELKQFSTILHENKEALHPELWEVFDQARSADPSEHDLSDHVRRCPDCKRDTEYFGTASTDTTLPARLWERMIDPEPEKTILLPHTSLLSWIMESIEVLAVRIRMPVLALGTACAAVFLVILLYPTSQNNWKVALSSEPWTPTQLGRHIMGPDGDSSSETAVPSKEGTLAVVLRMEDSAKPLSQEAIDAIYERLRPAGDVRNRFSVVSPNQVSEAVNRGTVRTATTDDLVRGLKDELGVTNLLLVDIRTADQRFSLKAELIDAATRKVMKQMTRGPVSEDELTESVREAALEIMGSGSGSR